MNVPLNRIEKTIAAIVGFLALGSIVVMVSVLWTLPPERIAKAFNKSGVHEFFFGANSLGMFVLGTFSLCMIWLPPMRIAFLIMCAILASWSLVIESTLKAFAGSPLPFYPNLVLDVLIYGFLVICFSWRLFGRKPGARTNSEAVST